MQHILEKIRRTDIAHKKKILIVLTVISMIVIITGWIFYMNTFVFTNPNEQTTAEIKVDFWPVFTKGMSVTTSKLGTNIKNVVSNMISRIPKFGGENKMTIENPK